MIESCLTIVVFGRDSDTLAEMAKFATALPFVSFALGVGRLISQHENLDALWMTPMMASEALGISVLPPLHRALVVATPAGKYQEGYPRYVVLGVLTATDDPKTPEFETRLVIKALLDAVRQFDGNQSCDSIRRVGILPEDLGITRQNLQKCFEIIGDEYNNRLPV